MLVLANGAFKSGSTWLREIVAAMRPFEPLPAGFHVPRIPSYADPVAVPALLASGVPARRNLLAKAHIYAPHLRDALLADPSVRVLNIRRDIRDVLVSHYFHLSHLGKVSGPFARYYWRLGRLKAQQLLDYHAVWDVSAANLYAARYESLKERFADEVAAVGRFLGVDLDAAAIARIEAATSLDRLRQRAGQIGHDPRFFRQGGSGGWAAHFDQRMLDDLREIEAHGLDRLGRLRYALLFGLRLRLKERLAHRGGPLATVAARL